jgi:hypothetical protein
VADVFISYSRLDQERVKRIAERLLSLGYSVSWDKSERARQGFIDERTSDLEAARAVLAVWSVDGGNSSQLHAAAAYAFDAGKLLQVRLDATPPPAPFDSAAVFDMSGTVEWGEVEHALAQLVRNGESAPAQRTPMGLMATIAAAGSPKLVSVAMIAALTAYAGALSAAFNGVMSADQLQIAIVGMIGVAGACAGLSLYRYRSITRADA